MLVAATIEFIDGDSNDNACVIVRYDEASISLGVSLKSDGDITVVMPKEDAKSLFNALKTALA